MSIFNPSRNGGSGYSVGVATKTPSYGATSISFTDLLGEPKAFFMQQSGMIYFFPSSERYRTISVAWDGDSITAVVGNLIGTSSGQISPADSTSTPTFTYNNNELTINCGGSYGFHDVEYTLFYFY